jgi:signal transduction histidine kinase
MTTPAINIPDTLQPFSEALQRSMRFYEQIRFSPYQDTLLKAFVDIIHNDHSLERFFQVSVTVPPLLGNFQAEFYLYEQKANRFLRVCDSETGLIDPPRPNESELATDISTIVDQNERRFYPLYPRTGTTRQDPRSEKRYQGLYDPDPYFASHSLLGLYGVFPATEISDADDCFFQILTRWIGNKLNNRLIANRHLEHLQFLNALGRDIGHNIIVPNMQLKYLLRQMEKQLDELRELEEKAQKMAENGISTRKFIDNIAHCRRQREALEGSYRELLKHHTQISLYLESLFREQHFKEGHLVLKPTRCFVERDIILPQLDLYIKKLEHQGITIEKPTNLYQQEFPLMVDIGLLSQVYANLFSNAVKYTEEIISHEGKPRKAMAYGAEIVQDFPVPGRQGIKFNVFTTGPPLSDREREAIFQEGGRLANSNGIEGSGHGLDFIRRVIEVHGGRVGCEPTPEGNNFYFILPISEVEEQQAKKHEQ